MHCSLAIPKLEEGEGAIIPIPNSVILTSSALSSLISKVSVALNLVWLQEAAKNKPTENVIYSALCTLHVKVLEGGLRTNHFFLLPNRPLIQQNSSGDCQLAMKSADLEGLYQE